MLHVLVVVVRLLFAKPLFSNMTYIHSLTDQNVLLRSKFRASVNLVSRCFFFFNSVDWNPFVPFVLFFSFFLTRPSLHSALGGVPSPFDCYLCNRGLKTLHLRMEQHFKNAMAAAKFLEADPRVERVIFPGGLNKYCLDSANFFCSTGWPVLKESWRCLRLFEVLKSQGCLSHWCIIGYLHNLMEIWVSHKDTESLRIHVHHNNASSVSHTFINLCQPSTNK